MLRVISTFHHNSNFLIFLSITVLWFATCFGSLWIINTICNCAIQSLEQIQKEINDIHLTRYNWSADFNTLNSILDRSLIAQVIINISFVRHF